VAGSVIVTTPQDLALLDAKKGVEMFRKVNIPVLGVVENMAVHICSNCGHAEHLFGEAVARSWRPSMASNCWPRCRCRWRFASRPTAASPPWRPSRMARSP
jgi:ATP-binding protein involved in chromosome partitioning